VELIQLININFHTADLSVRDHIYEYQYLVSMP